ncbi:MAG: hypothetical protein U0K36_02835 [Bacteroidales bacterium]|nr:hypothetical protein [Bacteroidales bacterium]
MSDEYNLTPYNRAEGNEPAESDWNVSPIAYDGNDDLAFILDDCEEERLSALQIAGLTNEQIDARINKLEQDLMKRWENQKQLVRDLEAMGPAPSRMDALVDAVKDEFGSVQNAATFIKWLVTKGPTPQQKLIQVGVIAYNIVRKLAACVAEIRKREMVVRQQITEGNVILSKTEEVKDLSRQRSYNTMQDVASSINNRHEEAAAAINNAIQDIEANDEQIRKNAEESASMSSDVTGFSDDLNNTLDDILRGLKD